MRYPIAIEPGDAEHGFGVLVPDLPGCFSAGDTLDEAMDNAKEAILFWLEDAVDEGQRPPAPRPIRERLQDPEYAGWIWAVVEVDSSSLGGKATRVNITLPERLLAAVDAHVKSRGETRSGFLARAALAEMQRDAEATT